MSIKLIAGLRNTGPAYAKTRHNAGAWFVEAVAQNNDVPFRTDLKLKGDIALLSHYSTEAKLFLPLGFMNHSGIALRAITQFYRILPEEILVAHDDLDLPVGHIKLKSGGGHGGHNGLRDIIAQLGSQNFYRIRIGIGHPGHRDKVHDYVLGTPSAVDKQNINEAIMRSLTALPELVEGKIALAMNHINCIS